MSNEKNSKTITDADLATLVEGKPILAVAFISAGGKVSSHGKVSEYSLQQLHEILISTNNHLDILEPPQFLTTELDNEPVIIQSLPVSQEGLLCMVFALETPIDIVAYQTACVSTGLNNFLSESLEGSVMDASLTDWYHQQHKITPEDEKPMPEVFGSRPEPEETAQSGEPIANGLLAGSPLIEIMGLNELGQGGIYQNTNDPSENCKPMEENDWHLLESDTQPGILSLQTPDIQPTGTLQQEESSIQPWDPETKPQAVTPGTTDLTQKPKITGPIDVEQEITTFYLVPKDKSQYILGELALRLRRWVPETCKTYGWRLCMLAVRPDYLKWCLVDFPQYAIQGMLKLMREETSSQIFHDFPALAGDNQILDYWSSSYLVDKKNQQYSTQSLVIMMAKDRLSH